MSSVTHLGLVLAGALLITAAIWATTPVAADNGGLGFDGVFYAAMAGHPEINPQYARVRPWAYRVATPAVVSWLPWDTLTNFRIVSFISSAAGLFLVFLILEQLGFAAAPCWIGVVLYAGVFWAVKFAFYAPAYIDAATQLLLLLIIYLTIRGSFVPLIAVMIVAVLVKESLIAFVLFVGAALYRQHGLTTRSCLIFTAVVVASLLTIGVVQSTVTTVTGLDTAAEIRDQLRLLASPPYWAVLLQATFSGLGLLAIVAALRPRRWSAFARERYEWLVYVATAAVLLLGGRDKGRLFLYLVPAAVIFAVTVIEDVQALKRGTLGLVWVSVLVLAHAFIGNQLTPIGSVNQYLARLAPEHAEARYLPYLWTNLAIAAGYLGLTWVLLSRRPTAIAASPPRLDSRA